MEDFLAERLRKVRLDRGMTQRNFADKLGIGLRTLRRFEDGQSRPKYKDLQAYCALSGKSPDYFLSSEGTPS